MKKIDNFISFDNIIFINENDCIEHEKHVKNFFDNVIFFGVVEKKIKPIFSETPQMGDPFSIFSKTVEELVRSAYHIRIRPELDFDFAQKINVNLIDFEEAGVFRFDGNSDRFINLETLIAEREEYTNSLKSLLSDILANS